MVKSYKKKPVVIEAIQLTIHNCYNVTAFIEGEEPDIKSKDAQIWWERYEDIVKSEGLKIKTLEGTMTANIGDYTIKGIKGEFYPCKPDIFEQTYELIGTEPKE